MTRSLGVGKGAVQVTRVGCGVDAVLEKGPAPWGLSASGGLQPAFRRAPLVGLERREGGRARGGEVSRVRKCPGVRWQSLWTTAEAWGY